MIPMMPCGCVSGDLILVVKLTGILTRKNGPNSQILIEDESNIAHSQWNIAPFLSKMISNPQGIGWTGTYTCGPHRFAPLGLELA